MKQTVLNISNVPGIRPLYYFSFGITVASGFTCLLFVYFLLSNYYAPYSPEKLNALMLQQKEWDAERQKNEQKDEPLAAVEQATSNTEWTEDVDEKGNSGQRPNVDLASVDTTSRLIDPPAAPFLMFPSDYTQLLELRGQLAKDPENQEIREQIRDLDQQLRGEYFRRKEIARQGAPILLIAAILCVISARIASVLNRPIPVTPQTADPQKQRQEEKKQHSIGTWAVIITAVFCAGIAMGLFFYPKNDSEVFILAKQEQELQNKETIAQTEGQTVTSPLSDNSDSGLTKTSLTQEQEAFLTRMQKNWPSFRGFDGSGISPYTNILTSWDVESGDGILWQSEVSLPGHNSPIVWEDKVFLSGADAESRKVYCFDTETGMLIWEFDVPPQSDSSTELKMGVSIMEDTGYAAPTLATDGERIYAIFANLDLVAIDYEGSLVWGKNLGVPENHYGYSASLALYFDRIIVQYDQGDGRKPDQSRLWAFRGTTGEIIWETPRTMMNSWPSPIIRQIGDRFQILTGADPWFVAYDPESGQEIWRCKSYGGGDTAPSPTGWGDVVFAANASPGVVAMNATGTGDISKSEKELWKEIGARPDTCSPIAYEKYLYSLGPGPYLHCIDTEQGIMIWELETDDYASFYSSPSLVNGLLYLFDKNEDGAKAYVIDPKKAVFDESGTELESGTEKEMIISVNNMVEPIFSSPAFADGKMFIRGTSTLYCIGK